MYAFKKKKEKKSRQIDRLSLVKSESSTERVGLNCESKTKIYITLRSQNQNPRSTFLNYSTPYLISLYLGIVTSTNIVSSISTPRQY